MKFAQACRGKCKEYAAAVPAGGRRYAAGHARCQVCEVWLDPRGACMQDGSPAADGPAAWLCRCCRVMLRRSPRMTRSKSGLAPKARTAGMHGGAGGGEVDLSYFSRRRGEILKRIAALLPRRRGAVEDSEEGYARIGAGDHDVAHEFANAGLLLDLAYDLDPPNKVSLAIEFERVKIGLGRVPTREDFGSASSVSPDAYDSEFGSWANFLDKMGYDPWYRRAGGACAAPGPRARHGRSGDPRPGPPGAGRAPEALAPRRSAPRPRSLDGMRERIMGILGGDPDALLIFEMMEKDIGAVDKDALRRIALQVGRG